MPAWRLVNGHEGAEQADCWAMMRHRRARPGVDGAWLRPLARFGNLFGWCRSWGGPFVRRMRGPGGAGPPEKGDWHEGLPARSTHGRGRPCPLGGGDTAGYQGR